MIHYRTFRNTDPPLLCAIWNEAVASRRATPIGSTSLLEFFTLAKPYFDPAGLILALDDTEPIGMAHAGFASNADGTDLDRRVGVLCVLGVVPARRGQGVGSELLRLAEKYLREQGATEIHAGPMAPRNPFTFGLYGGCTSVGFLESDTLIGPFLERRGYRLARSCGLFQRPLERSVPLNDPRTAIIRQRYDIIAAPYFRAGWWRECVLGPVEAVEYRLQEKQSEQVVARAVLWDMETFAPMWNQASVGMLDLEVAPDVRRQGLARYLLAQVLRHLREQPSFQVFEAAAGLDNAAALGLLRDLDFQEVERGHGYERT